MLSALSKLKRLKLCSNGYGMHELLANMAYVLEMPILRKPI